MKGLLIWTYAQIAYRSSCVIRSYIDRVSTGPGIPFEFA